MRDFRLDNKPWLLALRESLVKKSEIIAKLDEEILGNLEEMDEISDEIKAGEAVQIQIRTQIHEIDCLLKKVNEAYPDVKPGRVDLDEGDVSRSKLKLPKLEIVRFGGNPKEYRAFFDAFNVAVGKISSISDIEKFTYLRSYVIGEAADAIKGLETTEKNYMEALDILEKRFGNKQVIVNCHVDALIKLPAVIGANNTKQLRRLYDEIEMNLRSLKSLGMKPDSFGCLLVPILLSKLPGALNLHLSRKFDSNTDVWRVDDIMDELKKELEARERCQAGSERSNERGFRRIPSTTEALHTEGYQGIICAYCEGTHYSDRCKTVTDVNRRKETSRRRGVSCVPEQII